MFTFNVIGSDEEGKGGSPEGVAPVVSEKSQVIEEVVGEDRRIMHHVVLLKVNALNNSTNHQLLNSGQGEAEGGQKLKEA